MGLPSRMTGKEFSEMVKTMEGKLFRFANHFLNDVQEAEDAVQESFSKFWQKRDQLKEVLKPEAFLMRMVKNESLDRIRNRGRNHFVPIEEQRLSIEVDDGMEERILALRKEIRSLPENFKSVIHLRDIEGLKYEEIGKILDLSLSDVKVRIHRGRKILREKITQQKWMQKN